MRILFFGDSIAQGFWDVECGGWVQRIRREYDQQTIKNMAGHWPAVYNLGVDGDTTASVVKRLSYEVEVRRFQQDHFILVFQVGIADTVFAEEEVMATPEQYHDELDVLISSAQHYSDRLLLVGLTPVDDKLCDPWPYYPAGNISLKNERILQFEEVLRKTCISKGIPHVQVFERFKQRQKSQELLADGLHPNEAGHKLIAELVKPELDKLLSADITRPS